MDDYLRGVVPQEASPSWYPAALQAQAIAARTYAAQQRSAAGVWSTYDICDSTACQAYGGSSLRSSTGVVTPIEYPQTDAAIAATAGQIRTYGGAPAFTQFSSSNGGFSVAGGQPYLVAKADPWDGAVANPMHTWTATLPVSTIQAYYPAVGKLQRIVITSRDGNGDWGGRINTVVLQGVDGAGPRDIRHDDRRRALRHPALRRLRGRAALDLVDHHQPARRWSRARIRTRE